LIAALIGLLLAAAEADLTAAHPPRAGAALYLAGLPRFRSGKPAEALEAIEAAGGQEDRPAAALWHYNRGACLYELGRRLRTTVDPFGYVGHTFWASARRRWGDGFVLDASAGLEWRGYVGDNLVLGAGNAVIDRRRREDTRYFAGAGAWLSINDHLGLTLRYDAPFSRSNLSGPDGNRQGDNRSYDKHVVTAGTSFLC